MLREYKNLCGLIEKCNKTGKEEYLELISDGREYYSRYFCFDNKLKY